MQIKNHEDVNNGDIGYITDISKVGNDTTISIDFGSGKIKEYGINEVTNPVRIITTTAKVMNGSSPVVSVKTKEPIPKELNFKCMEEINKVEVQAPVKIGDIIIENILNYMVFKNLLCYNLNHNN